MTSLQQLALGHLARPNPKSYGNAVGRSKPNSIQLLAGFASQNSGYSGCIQAIQPNSGYQKIIRQGTMAEPFYVPCLIILCFFSHQMSQDTKPTLT